MKKAFLFAFLVSVVSITIAQIPELDQLRKKLNYHPQEDTFRVNRLNEISRYIAIEKEEKEKFINEAYRISQKIRYPKGEGFALINSGILSSDNGDKTKASGFFHKADSIGKKISDFRLQASALYRIAFHTIKDPKEKEANFTKALSLARKSGDADLEMDLLRNIGFYYSGFGDRRGLYYYNEGEEIALKNDHLIYAAQFQNSTGNFYMINLSNYGKAMEYFFKALRNSERSKDPYSLISSWINIGSLYAVFGDQENALNYLLKAEEGNKKLGNKSIESSLQNSIGERYRLSGNYEKAIIAYNNFIRTETDPAQIELGQSNLADVYTRMGNLPLAFQYGFSSLKTAKEINDIIGVAWIQGILARAYTKKNMPDSAIHHATEGLSAATETGTIEFMRDNVQALANAYAIKKDFKNAYHYHLLYINYRDSMMNAEVRNKTSIQKYTYDLEKKQAQIAGLNAQKNYQRNFLIGSVVLLILILTSAVLLLRNNRLKQKANKQLQLQKEEIDEKAKELASQKDNVELLSEIGRKITSTLSVEKIISTVYDNVNALMDANVFGIGIYNDDKKRIEFPSTYENGVPLSFYSNDIHDPNKFGTVCFTKGKEIIINDLSKEYKNHIQNVVTVEKGNEPASLIFLPLISKGEKLGVITVQSFKKNAYSDYQLFMLRNIATYTAIAIENAESYETLNKTFSSLKATQTQLIQSEKMASLGELTAGIAHEIQNPLNFVNNFSEVNDELVDELKVVLSNVNGEKNKELENELLTNIQVNTQKIIFHGKRADAIVKGMLQHSRSSTGAKEPTDINALCDEYLRLSYHGLRAKDKTFNASMKTSFDESIQRINIIQQDIGRVLLNLLNNAFYAVKQKQSELKVSGELKNDAVPYEPTVTISTKKSGEKIVIKVSDNGNGIPQNIIDKIFQPFFTTKPTGQGTGLGLSLSYDILKIHGGEIELHTKENEGTEFEITLPA